MNEAVLDYYAENKRHLISDFRSNWIKDEHDEVLPENDEDLENEYKDILLEMAKDWYAVEVDIINTDGILK